MRLKVISLLLLLALFACQEKTDVSDGTATTQPNVLFLAVDDLNDWLGCMDGHAQAWTPHMDRLAAEGVLFANAHCQAPLCGPSRASLMTGLRPSTTGIYGMIDDDSIRSQNVVTRDIVFLPEYFQQQGYHTMGIGKLFHQHAPTQCFDESGGRRGGFGPVPDQRFHWDGHGTADRRRYGRTSTDWGAYPEADSLMPDYRSATWAVERLQRTHDKPFFLAVGFLRPHVPWYVPARWFDLYDPDSLDLPPYLPEDLDDLPPIAHQINDLPMMPTTAWAKETGQWKYIVQSYLASVSFVDEQVGRVLAALRESPYANNTVIVLWSDHGYRLGEKGTFAKHALWEEATHAPLMFAGPDLPQGRVVQEPVEMLSIYPTLIDLCRLPSYDRNEGNSLLPLMNDQADIHSTAVTTFGRNNHTVRTQHYRYIRYEDGTEELYDRRSDPNEWHNLAYEPMHAAKKSEFHRMLPVTNAPWAHHSQYRFQPYFVEQKARDRGE